MRIRSRRIAELRRLRRGHLVDTALGHRGQCVLDATGVGAARAVRSAVLGGGHLAHEPSEGLVRLDHLIHGIGQRFVGLLVRLAGLVESLDIVTRSRVELGLFASDGGGGGIEVLVEGADLLDGVLPVPTRPFDQIERVSEVVGRRPVAAQAIVLPHHATPAGVDVLRGALPLAHVQAGLAVAREAFHLAGQHARVRRVELLHALGDAPARLGGAQPLLLLLASLALGRHVGRQNAGEPAFGLVVLREEGLSTVLRAEAHGPTALALELLELEQGAATGVETVPADLAHELLRGLARHAHQAVAVLEHETELREPGPRVGERRDERLVHAAQPSEIVRAEGAAPVLEEEQNDREEPFRGLAGGVGEHGVAEGTVEPREARGAHAAELHVHLPERLEGTLHVAAAQRADVLVEQTVGEGMGTALAVLRSWELLDARPEGRRDRSRRARRGGHSRVLLRRQPSRNGNLGRRHQAGVVNTGGAALQSCRTDREQCAESRQGGEHVETAELRELHGFLHGGNGRRARRASGTPRRFQGLSGPYCDARSLA
ncbi:MAG: hypothetical protein QNK04_12660 [Myxococcota bacterium]|nr:hypothetical protein [Myxococcota bacterium]